MSQTLQGSKKVHKTVILVTNAGTKVPFFNGMRLTVKEAAEVKYYPTIFLSDIHLGTKDCQAAALLDFLKNHRCDRLYLVGDIIDGWRLRSGMYWPQAHNDVLRRILTLAKRGTKVTFVTGNHDEFLRKYSPMVFGNLELVDEAEHQAEDGKRYLVLHGDQYDVVTRYYRWLAVLGDYGYSLLLFINRYYNQFRRWNGKDHWSLSAYVKQRVKTAVSFVSEFETAVAQDCRRQDFDGVVCGHIHHAEIRDIGGVTYMNCGDWVESCTAMVEQPGGCFEIVHWHAQDSGVVSLLPNQPKEDALHDRPQRLRA